MPWRSEWSRHYDQIQWTVTTILTGSVSGLVAYSYTVKVGDLDRFVLYLGFVLTWLTVYYAASFRELRRLLHTKIQDKEEKDFLLDPPHKLKQWPVFLLAFFALAVALVILCLKHGWCINAIVFGTITAAIFVYLSVRGASSHDIDR